MLVLQQEMPNSERLVLFEISCKEAIAYSECRFDFLIGYYIRVYLVSIHTTKEYL